MLKQLIAYWKNEQFMGQVVQEFGEMISDAEYVFTKSWEAISDHIKPEDVKKDIYGKDKAVNKKERDIRRKLMEHLSFNPRQDTSGCLAIMSLVKDVERIGDYSKNIFDLRLMLGESIKGMRFFEDFLKIQRQIAEHFPKIKKAFLDSDEELAREILKKYTSVKEDCNKILKELFIIEISSKEAVATALLSPYLKRINSHLSNVASGIILPINEIDFVRGDLLE